MKNRMIKAPGIAGAFTQTGSQTGSDQAKIRINIEIKHNIRFYSGIMRNKIAHDPLRVPFFEPGLNRSGSSSSGYPCSKIGCVFFQGDLLLSQG